MSTTLVPILHTLRAAFGAYNLYLCSISIRNLRQYEATSEKAAEWSNTAADQLWQTRKTQGSGTLAILTSFLSSAYFLVTSPTHATTELGVAVVNVAVLLAAYRYVGEFWKGKAKIPMPGLSEYNRAIGSTMETRGNMLYLMGSWIVGGCAVALRWAAA